MADLGLLPTLNAFGSGVFCLFVVVVVVVVVLGGTALPISPIRIPEDK